MHMLVYSGQSSISQNDATNLIHLHHHLSMSWILKNTQHFKMQYKLVLQKETKKSSIFSINKH